MKPAGVPRTALITGITGQDGLYLVAYLLFHMRQYDYTVYGIVRKNSATLPFLQQYQDYLAKLQIGSSRKLILVTGDITDQMFMFKTIDRSQPQEIYNLAAQTHVMHSFDTSQSTFEANINGLLYICDAVLSLKMTQKVKIFHASTSEMFGEVVR